MKKIKWGIIGTGRIANQFTKALVYCENSIPYAVASRTKEKAINFAKEYNMEKSYGSYKELVKDDDIDVVYIATPMKNHYEDTMLCLNNGKNVFCEKAVTLNSKELEEILKVAKEKNLFFMEAMWMKCMPSFLKAVELVNDGKIGSVSMVKAEFTNMVPYDENDRVFRLDCGGGALLDLGVYTITFATAFLGNTPLKISSVARMGQSGVDFDEVVILHYDNDRFATLTSGFNALSRNNATIVGTKGSITFGDYFFFSEEMIHYDENNNVIKKYEFKHDFNGYEYEIREVEKCLIEKKIESNLVPHEGTMSVMKIMDSCRQQWGLKYIGE